MESPTGTSARPWLFRYGLAVGASLLAAGVTATFPALRGIPFMLSFGAIAIAVSLGGFREGLLATFISVVAINTLVLSPRGSSALGLTALVQTAVATVAGIAVCTVARERERKH
ncbi:MAG: DUF4118 domain-containing protein, partial [Candidatus Korobacteraceae bacterium]